MKGAGRSDDLGPPFFPGPVLDIFAKIVILGAVILGAFRRVERLAFIFVWKSNYWRRA